MDCKRNRINSLIELMKKNNIEINLLKNKARGNRGFFLTKNNKFRIDIAKGLNKDEILTTLLHEFAHFVHAKFDNSLTNLDFIFKQYDDNIEEELLKITINKVPKEFALSLISKRDNLKKEINELANSIKDSINIYKNKKYTAPLSYLLKYEKIIYNKKTYCIDDLQRDFRNISKEEYIFFQWSIKNNLLKKYNRRINKINKYYSSKSELFARFIETYYNEKEVAKNLSPTVYKIYEQQIENKSYKILNDLHNIFFVCK